MRFREVVGGWEDGFNGLESFSENCSGERNGEVRAKRGELLFVIVC